ncbi:MAG: 3-deoxy-8-phosphooctulonate synthase [Pseudomonas fluorescens]|nr:MAG: 3-deoxy-8-phosphooctulonate synthase [Pseudomonas fluorescens]
MQAVTIGAGSVQKVQFGNNLPLVIIAGTCAIESRETTLKTASHLAKVCQNLGIGLIYKGSFDKANRTSAGGKRGSGLEEGLGILSEVRSLEGLPVLTDVHETIQVEQVYETVDIAQIPAFLARQTDLLIACGKAAARTAGKGVNIKKGQFMAPADMGPASAKVVASGTENILLTERGTTFGYGDLVVDMRGLPTMASTGFPVVFDVTHSIMQPSGKGDSSTGKREFAAPLARAAVATGIQGLFLETHPDPATAISDRDTQLPLASIESFLYPLVELHKRVQDLAQR